MTRKRLKLFISLAQAAAVATLFLPWGRLSGAVPASGLNAFDAAQSYGSLGLETDATVFVALACCLPLLTVLSVLFLRPRRNYGMVACLCALSILVIACFATSAKVKLSGSVALTGAHDLTILAQIASMALGIYGFLSYDPNAG